MPVAQWLEQHPHKMLVASSSLVRRTIQTKVNTMSEVFHIGDLHFGHQISGLDIHTTYSDVCSRYVSFQLIKK